LCADFAVLGCLAAATGGLRSPACAAQVALTLLFAQLFPAPWALLPPLLALAGTASLANGPAEVSWLFWHSTLDVIAVGLCIYLQDRDRNQDREGRRLAAALRDLEVAEERNRLSRDIHDGLGGALSAVAIESEHLLRLIDEPHWADGRVALSQSLQQLRQTAQDSMDELRRSLRMMQDDFDLVSTLADCCRTATARHRLDVRFSSVGIAAKLPSESALVLFRILQEALANVARHCGAGTAVEVTLRFEPRGARLRIADRGNGFAIPSDGRGLVRGGHYGLANMRERARKARADLRIESAIGQGTCIEVAVRTEEKRRS
jgi:two-component system, NarL family, sensor histidine kinase DegS